MPTQPPEPDPDPDREPHFDRPPDSPRRGRVRGRRGLGLRSGDRLGGVLVRERGTRGVWGRGGTRSTKRSR